MKQHETTNYTYTYIYIYTYLKQKTPKSRSNKESDDVEELSMMSTDVY